MVYLDASVLVPLAVPEASSAAMERWFTVHAPAGLAAGRWALVEFASAIGIRVRRGSLTAQEGTSAVAAFEGRIMPELELVEALPDDLDFARLLISRFDLGLRGGDALHVAMALRTEALLLLTLDRRLANAARAFGLDAAEPA